MVKYTRNSKGEILKDGHTMFPGDVLTDLKRKAFLEEDRENNQVAAMSTKPCEFCKMTKVIFKSAYYCANCGRALSKH